MRLFYCLIFLLLFSCGSLNGMGFRGTMGPGGTKDLGDFDWIYMVPGLGYQVMQFGSTVGPRLFHGAQIEYVFVGGRSSRAEESSVEDVDPDRDSRFTDFRFYGKIGLLSANVANTSRMFMGGLGINFSFEGNMRRNFLIPYYGFECNVFNQSEKKGGLVFTPVVGLFIYSSSQLRINYTAGANLMPAHYETYRSVSQSLTVNYSLW